MTPLWRSSALLPFLYLLLIAFFFLPTFLGEQNKAAAATTANLIAHWRFSEGSSTYVSDSSGNGYHGTAVNGS